MCGLIWPKNLIFVFFLFQMSRIYIEKIISQKPEPKLCITIPAPESNEFCQEPDLYLHNPAVRYKAVPKCPDHPNIKLKRKKEDDSPWCVGWENKEFSPRWAYGITRNICVIATRYNCENCEKDKRSTHRAILEFFYDVYDPNIIFLRRSAIHLDLYNYIVIGISRGEKLSDIRNFFIVLHYSRNII